MSDDVFCIIDKQLNCQGINVGIGIKKSLDKQPIDFDSVLLTKSKKYYFQNIQYQNTIKLSKVIDIDVLPYPDFPNNATPSFVVLLTNNAP